MRIISDVPEDLWWSVAEQCQYSTFFHTPLWTEIACETNGEFKNQTIGAEFSNGTKIIFPLLKTKDIYVFKNLQSTYAGCYGGPIADGVLIEHEFMDFLDEIRSWRTGRLGLLENPLVVDEYPDLDSSTGWESENYFTQILELEDDFDTIHSNFSKDRRYGVRKARRENVSVRIATSLEDYQAYFGAYEASLERWNDISNRYYWGLFKSLYNLSNQYPENIKLWVTEVNGEVVTGALMLYWNDHVVNWHAASYSDYLSLYPNDLLHAEIIADAIKNNYQYYDFNPSGGHEGVVNFKNGFGPERWEINKLSFEGELFRKARKLKGQIEPVISGLGN
ncbi:GNAT family N-acetyltransferase [Haladaptatus sp. YSMS36]|uniref:lipid II:glycine glycyltransferase FemX n=1 Tax=Haladaptatus sp. YSMS36 TaxID=3033384 RepID=UPI0023E892DE|nr:GNAT family N-acetyltransferase [Haladaptatus sp. YSMS36]